MKIEKIRLWRFQCFGPQNPTTDKPEAPTPVEMSLDAGITALIGRNGSGKSAILAAIVRLFGETRDERAIRAEDFFVEPGQTLEQVPLRQLYIEAEFSFPELASGDKEAEKTVPSAFRNMVVDRPKGDPIARVRLEATWELAGTLDGTIEENIYWLNTTDPVPFGDVADPNIKRKMNATERAHVAVRFIPASRDVTSLTKLTVRSLGRSLMQSVRWQNEAKIKQHVQDAATALMQEDALKRVNQSIDACWAELNAADTATKAEIHVLPPDFQRVVKAASIVLNPSPLGRTMSVEDLSDGQRSLFHFALVKALLDLKLSLEAQVSKGETPPFATTFMRAPALTIFAFEEPENHLAPYFLSKLITELQKLSGGQRVQAVLTSHSPAIVGRLQPEALRHVRRNPLTGVSVAAALTLPDSANEAAKFVREAVRAHPEIYFARHAIFGEGATEEIVLPRLAEALDIPIDRSFVAIVPIGGRHVQHFWRLVSQLGISYTTLLDLDLGRSTGDYAQFKAVAKAILEFSPPADATALGNVTVASSMARDATWNKSTSKTNIEGWADFFETQHVFFSSPLDLDMLMLESFPKEYQKLPPGARGPDTPDDPVRQLEAANRVLKRGGFGPDAYDWLSTPSLFPWYSYLFQGNRGKPAAHLAALAELDNGELAKRCPPVLKRLLERVKLQLETSPG